MSTNWTLPNLIIQYPEETAENNHIMWNDLKKFPLVTSKDLQHIARSPKTDLKDKTYFLKFSQFNFENLPAIISGIELRLSARRRGRITDETIQLYIDNSLLGENKASLILDPIKIYGGNDDKWGLETISVSSVANLNFGIVMRFQSHPKWPHKDSAIIDLVELRIH